MSRTTFAPQFNLRSRVGGADLLGLGFAGLKAKPVRAALSALGIAIGIAAMVAVVGISASSQGRINEQLSQLGTNLLSAEPGKTIAGPEVSFPADAAERVARISGVTGASSVATLADVSVYRNSRIDAAQSGGISVVAAPHNLLSVVGASVRDGTWFNRATGRYPTTVLGAFAAEQLGVTSPGGQVWLGGRNVKVIGVLKPLTLAADLDSAAFVGIPFATGPLEHRYVPTRLYERSTDDAVATVRSLLGPATLPETPKTISVSRPSDALAAKAAVNEAFTSLLLGLGSIALLVGGIGVANTMVIAVLERRREIGLRRALGATKKHVCLQFFAEALILSAIGGIAGAVIGSGVSAIVAVLNGWTPVIPPLILGGAVGATLVIGGIAGLYPAIRAAATPPTVALNG